MPDIVGVRFRKAGKIYYFDPLDLPIEQYSHVIVETVRGVEIGEVAIGRRSVPEAQTAPYLPLKEVIRIATEEDIAHWHDLQERARAAFDICLTKISQHRLDMKLLDAEYTFDSSKLIFQFISEGRVDFRDLVRDIASVFRTRIELRQVGVRDEAKMIGGLGGCGRELCCCSFLGDFLPVSIKMARDQNLSLNPAKISGVCGRLLCCLSFEMEDYGVTEQRSDYIEIGAYVSSEQGLGHVLSVNSRRKTAKVKLDGGGTKDISLSELTQLGDDYVPS